MSERQTSETVIERERERKTMMEKQFGFNPSGPVKRRHRTKNYKSYRQNRKCFDNRYIGPNWGLYSMATCETRIAIAFVK